MFLIVHEVRVFFIVQDLPPAKTRLPVILAPPLLGGSTMRTVIETLPFFIADEVIEDTVGEEGLVTDAWALVDVVKLVESTTVAIRLSFLFTSKVLHLCEIPAFHAPVTTNYWGFIARPPTFIAELLASSQSLKLLASYPF